MIRPATWYDLWIYVGGVCIQVRCTELFETAEEEVVCAFDQTVDPGCIFGSGDVLDVLFGTVIVDNITVEVLPAIAHESVWDGIVKANSAERSNHTCAHAVALQLHDPDET